MKYIVVFITTPKNEFKKISIYILKNKLAACVNVIKNVNSFYWWKGKICNDKESLLIVKTTQRLFKKIVKEVKKIHPYEVPEIISFPIIEGDRSYLSWVKNSVRK